MAFSFIIINQKQIRQSSFRFQVFKRKRYNYASMSVYTIEHGYRKSKRWPYVIFVPILLVSMTYFFIGRGYGDRPSQTKTTVTQALSQPASIPPVVSQPRITTPLPWPSYGQAAYGVIDDGVLASSSEKEEPVAVASLAKTITALAVLKQKPLAPGEQGPMITLTEADEALYREYVAKSGTVVPVKAGVQISQYQALQAMLMPSANNISDTLVRWAFGSVEEYNKYANEMLREYGISQTTIADASGYSSETKSTASDMVKIGLLYMQNPILQEIALQPKATIPFAGVIYNNNATHNEDGVVGIKIGFTEEAGKTFMVADIKAANKDEISVVAILGAKSMTTAIQDAERLLKSGKIGHDQLSEKQP